MPEADRNPLTTAGAGRLTGLLEACWDYLDKVVAGAPEALRKGPRGGGRDRDAVFQHVLNAEQAYASGLGVRLREPDRSDGDAVAAMRGAILGAIQDPVKGAKWPPRYAARRIAWHVLDHAWEIQDRTP